MKIETKFSVNDKVWIIANDGSLKETVISSISITVYGKTYNPNMDGVIEYQYSLRDPNKSGFSHCEKFVEKMYKTKQEAGEAWMKSQGLKCGVSNN